MSVTPSGLLPSSLKRPHGSREEEMWKELKTYGLVARWILWFRSECLENLPLFLGQLSP
jgi:hypothetical protein